jgi:uncharacterized phage protein gp47/JayE
MEIKSFGEIYSDVRDYIIAHQDKITDFNDGSVLSSEIEAFSREIAELYIRCRVGYSSFLRGLPYSIFGFEQKPGQQASTTVVFYRSKPKSYETTIPEGTIVSASGLRFTTTDSGKISPENIESNEISVIAEKVGEEYNIEAGAINSIVSTLTSDIVSATNPNPATGGAAEESWKDYIARFADYIIGLQRTNEAGFRTGLTGAYVVRSLSIVEHFPPLDDLWNMTVYLDDGSGGISDLGKELVKKTIDGDGTPGNGGYRAPGINIRYLSPEKEFIDLIIDATTVQDVTNEIDESVVISDVQKKTKEFIDGLKIGESLILSDLIVVLRRITYLDDVRIKAPEENIIISADKIARYRNCTVNVTVG